MKWYSWMFIGVLLLFVCLISGCSEEEYYLCDSCGEPNLTDVNVYNCTSRTTGETGYDYTTNDYYYCNTTTWVKLNNQSGSSETTIINNTYYINTTNNITNNVVNNITYNFTNSTQCASNSDYIYNISIDTRTNSLTSLCRTDQTGGGTSTGLTINDLIANPYYFSRYDMESVTAGYTERWIPTAIGGTSAVAIGQPNHPGLITISNAVAVNTGYSYSLGNSAIFSLDNDYFTVLSFNATVNGVTHNISNTSIPINGTQMRFGFMDAYLVTGFIDGCIINITQQNMTNLKLYGACQNNSIASRTATNYSLENKTWYTTAIYVHNKSNLVKFYVWNEQDVLLWSDNVTTQIPFRPGRETGHALVVYRNGNSTARVQGVFDYMSIGINRTINR